MILWRRDPLLGVILTWTTLVTGVLVWLPLVRGATQGNAYRWELAQGIGGRGIAGDYWMIVLAAIFVFFLLYLGWQGGRRPFHWLLLVLHVPLTAAVAYAGWTNPDDFRFEGATIGADFSLAVIGPAIFGVFLAAAVCWVVWDLRTRAPRPPLRWTWTRAAKVRLGLVVAFVPIEVWLFRSGGIQSTQNLVGVFFVGYQWVLVNLILATKPAGSTLNAQA